MIEDLDLSGVKELTGAHLSNVTITRVVFKGSTLLVSPRCGRHDVLLILPQLLRALSAANEC